LSDAYAVTARFIGVRAEVNTFLNTTLALVIVDTELSLRDYRTLRRSGLTDGIAARSIRVTAGKIFGVEPTPLVRRAVFVPSTLYDRIDNRASSPARDRFKCRRGGRDCGIVLSLVWTSNGRRGQT
jgi:hypothetical protein